MINIIPLAWKWERFKKAWYKNPKPLIDIFWKKMIFRAFESLPKSDKNIFICSKDHIDNYNIDKNILSIYPESIVLKDNNPTWQASSVYLSKGILLWNDIINIWACDNSMTYDINRYNKLIKDKNIDFLVWCFKGYYWINNNPNEYSYCITDKNNNIKSVSLKKKVSNTPIKDNTLVWAFTFKKSKYFFENYEKMFEKQDKINWEFYIDTLLNYCIDSWLRWKVFLVDKYIWFWTQNDLKTYKYYYEYFKLQKK